MGKFMNPMLDWAFKRIFGNKELLIDFLNSLLQGERVITDLRYLNNEREGEQMEQRKVIYDLYCETDTGEFIIVEMQNRWQKHFKDRALFYLSRSIVQQAEQGTNWNFELTAVYGVYFINFLLDKKNDEHFCKDVALIEKHSGKVFNNKFRQFFIELPRFTKSENECENNLEYWIYNLVNMEKLESISFKDRKAIFSRLEQLASQANLSKEERARLDREWMIYNDYFNTMDGAQELGFEKGHAEGMEKGMEKGMQEGMKKGMEKGMEKGRTEAELSIARKMKEQGMALDLIATCTGLSPEEIEKL